MPRKASPSSQTPTIQVIERMFTLLDVLAEKEEAVPLKELSEVWSSPLHDAPHPQ